MYPSREQQLRRWIIGRGAAPFGVHPSKHDDLRLVFLDKRFQPVDPVQAIVGLLMPVATGHGEQWMVDLPLFLEANELRHFSAVGRGHRAGTERIEPRYSTSANPKACYT
jgi:hypothetical protein